VTDARTGAWRTTLLLGAALAAALLPSNTVPTALALLRQEWGLSAAEGGMIYGAFQLGYGAGVLVLLPLVIAAGRRRRARSRA